MNTPVKSTQKTSRLSMNDRGQALAEATIMLSLLGFTWALFGYSAFMTNNGIRCVSASRHMAWMAGNGFEKATVEGTAASFYTADFMIPAQTTMSELSITNLDVDDPPNEGGSDANGIISEIAEFIVSIWTPKVFQCTATFGVADIDSATTYPFTLMKTRFPYMPESKIETFLNVDCSCSWERVDEIWDDPLDLLGAVLDGILEALL